MLIKIETTIYAEVDDMEQGEEAAHTINSLGHVRMADGFPHGEILKTKVTSAEKVKHVEADEEGLTE